MAGFGSLCMNGGIARQEQGLGSIGTKAGGNRRAAFQMRGRIPASPSTELALAQLNTRERVACLADQSDDSTGTDKDAISTTSGTSNDKNSMQLALVPSSNREDVCVDEGPRHFEGISQGMEKSRNVETSGRVLPSVGAFTVQCALCFKWRLIPTKEEYEKIRQFILENPFVCSRASSWRPNATCDDPADLSQDMSHLWAIDRPNIPLAPTGWERLLVLRGAGSTKFADVYYREPSGKKLRSMPEVERFLVEHPEHVNAGVSLSQFSFVIPRPLDQGYVRKRAAGDSLTYSRSNIICKKANNTNIGPNRPFFRPVSAKERSEKHLARRKTLARILAGGQSQGLQGSQQQDCLIIDQVTQSTQTSQQAALMTNDHGPRVSEDQTIGIEDRIYRDSQYPNERTCGKGPQSPDVVEIQTCWTRGRDSQGSQDMEGTTLGTVEGTETFVMPGVVMPEVQPPAGPETTKRNGCTDLVLAFQDAGLQNSVSLEKASPALGETQRVLCDSLDSYSILEAKVSSGNSS